MRKCTSFPSLVVLKHIHMSCMIPFLLLPPALALSLLLLLFIFLLLLFLHEKCLPWTDGCSDPPERCFPIVKLLLTLHTPSVTDPVPCEAVSTGPELLVELCANRGSRSLFTSHRLEHTHKSGKAFYRVWATFFFFFPFFLLSATLFSPCSIPSPCLRENWSFLKHVLNITIFTFSCFKIGSKGGSVCGVDFSCPFFLAGGFLCRVRLRLKL